MLIEVRGEGKKQDKLSRFAKKDSESAERELPFCELAEGGERKLGLSAVTSQDPQFVSDLCALLIEIFNLGVL